MVPKSFIIFAPICSSKLTESLRDQETKVSDWNMHGQLATEDADKKERIRKTENTGNNT